MAQDYARTNRAVTMQRALAALRSTMLPAFALRDTAVNCHYNYVSREYHFGADEFVTRKGAVHAGVGKLGIIPGSRWARDRTSFEERGTSTRSRAAPMAPVAAWAARKCNAGSR